MGQLTCPWLPWKRELTVATVYKEPAEPGVYNGTLSITQQLEYGVCMALQQNEGFTSNIWQFLWETVFLYNIKVRYPSIVGETHFHPSSQVLEWYTAARHSQLGGMAQPRNAERGVQVCHVWSDPESGCKLCRGWPPASMQGWHLILLR